MDTRRLTGPIALRLWIVVLVVGVAGLALLRIGIGQGMALVTIAALAAPIALVSTAALAFRRPAVRIPRWLITLGVVGSAAGLVRLLVIPGDVPAILAMAVGVWLLVVGLISSVAVGPLR